MRNAAVAGPDVECGTNGDEEEYLPGAKVLPGGKAEHGNLDNHALEATGIREIEEETGVILGPQLFYVRTQSNTIRRGCRSSKRRSTHDVFVCIA